MTAVNAGIQFSEIGLSITAGRVRASVSVVLARATVTLDPRGLNPIVLDVVSSSEVVSVSFLKPLDGEVLVTGDFSSVDFGKAAQESSTAVDASAYDLSAAKADAAAIADARSAALLRTVADAVSLDDFATRSFNGAYADHAGTDDFSEPVDDLGWAIARAVADPATAADAYAAAFNMAPISEPPLAATDAAASSVSKPVADTAAAGDVAPVLNFSRTGDQDSISAVDSVAQAFNPATKEEAIAATDGVALWDLSKAVLDSVAIDDFASRSFNGGYADQATTDDFSEPVDDLGWSLGRAVSENLYFEDPTYVSNDYVFALVAITDRGVFSLSRPVTDSAAASDAQQTGVSKPLTEAVATADASAMSLSLNGFADGGSYFAVDYNVERYGIGELATDASVRSFALPKTEAVAASDTVFPLEVSKVIADAVAIDDMAARSLNGSAADEATTDDFSQAEDDLGWGFDAQQADELVTADAVVAEFSPSLSDLIATADASQIILSTALVEAATAVDVPAKGMSLPWFADGGSYFTPDYNAERYGVGDLVLDNSTKSFSKSGIADSISLANTGGLVLTDYVDSRWFSDNYTGTYRSLS